MIPPPPFKTTMQFSFVNVAIFAALAVAFANAVPLSDRQSYDAVSYTHLTLPTKA